MATFKQTIDRNQAADRAANPDKWKFLDAYNAARIANPAPVVRNVGSDRGGDIKNTADVSALMSYNASPIAKQLTDATAYGISKGYLARPKKHFLDRFSDVFGGLVQAVTISGITFGVGSAIGAAASGASGAGEASSASAANAAPSSIGASTVTQNVAPAFGNISEEIAQNQIVAGQQVTTGLAGSSDTWASVTGAIKDATGGVFGDVVAGAKSVIAPLTAGYIVDKLKPNRFGSANPAPDGATALIRPNFQTNDAPGSASTSNSLPGLPKNLFVWVALAVGLIVLLPLLRRS